MEINSITEIRNEEKVTVRVSTSFISSKQMYVIDDKVKVGHEVKRLQQWVETQHAENMDFRSSCLSGKRCCLFIDITVGRKIKGDFANDDYDTFDHQHQFLLSWCDNCDEGCNYYDFKITNYHKNDEKNNISKTCSFDSIKQMEMYSLFINRIYEFIKETAY